MNKPEATRRMVQWAIELSQFDIRYHPKIAIKAQALTNFIAEFTLFDKDNLTDDKDRWFVSPKEGGVRVVITTPDEETLKYKVQLKFPATNNEAEYEGVLMGLRLGNALGAKYLLIQSDSKLVLRQIKEKYEAKEERMQKYLRLTKCLTQEFDRVEFIQIPKSQNTIADKIAKLTSSKEGSTSTGLKMEIQECPSIKEVLTFAIQSTSSWMTPIISFLQDSHLP